jgi:hypothetical protein
MTAHESSEILLTPFVCQFILSFVAFYHAFPGCELGQLDKSYTFLAGPTAFQTSCARSYI